MLRRSIYIFQDHIAGTDGENCQMEGEIIIRRYNLICCLRNYECRRNGMRPKRVGRVVSRIRRLVPASANHVLRRQRLSLHRRILWHHQPPYSFPTPCTTGLLVIFIFSNTLVITVVGGGIYMRPAGRFYNPNPCNARFASLLNYRTDLAPVVLKPPEGLRAYGV